MLTSAGLRKKFLDYFRHHGHEIVPSSSLIPVNDPTLLFTNAGMVQFKETFLGLESRSYQRAASAQRCVRAGGKHNDLENVGYTTRHHTFFEMLGNFSFGDYFKREAIRYAWEFLTIELAIPAEKLWVSVYEEDDEAADIWLQELGVSPERFARIGAQDNFWSMGDTGPCGPCSEIFYDHGPDVVGGPPGSPEADGDRYVEIWNLVFMQYNRDSAGQLTALPSPSVDTGMGLERLAAVMQGVHSNYEIDLFRRLVAAAAQLAGTEDREHASLRVIADHIRSCAFLIVDGVIPANEGRGYVLRRIIRRAIRHGYMLGIKEAFFYRLVVPLAEEMGEAYPELVQAREQVERVLHQEERRFAETLEQGMQILERDIAGLSSQLIAGETIFRLYDTYGFPVDLTADIARERGLQLDMAGFEQAMAAQRARARAAGHFAVDYNDQLVVEGRTEFTGYEHLAEKSRITAIFRANETADSLQAGEEGAIILEKTPFYAESGGQAGDQGLLCSGESQFMVTDTRKQGNGVIIHLGKMASGSFQSGDEVEAWVDEERRQATARNHSATHLLHAALRKLLGEHVTQKGSLVDADRLRFDFSHFEPLSRQQIEAIEALVNEQIRANTVVQTQVMAIDEARKLGAMALFGEKYGDQVRVLSMGDFSVELCGGTHVRRSGDIGLLKIIAESGIAAGVRRIEAVTGQRALEWVNEAEQVLADACALLKAGRENLPERLGQLLEHNRQLEKELAGFKARLASSAGDSLADRAQQVGRCKVLAARLDGVDAGALRNTLDQLKNKLGTAVIVLAAVDGKKISLVAGVTADCTESVKASELINIVASRVGGKGGGRPDMAQAGGNNPAALDEALAAVPEWVRQQLDEG